MMLTVRAAAVAAGVREGFVFFAARAAKEKDGAVLCAASAHGPEGSVVPGQQAGAVPLSELVGKGLDEE